MKAKEYAKRYLESESKLSELQQIIKDMFSEMLTLCKARNIVSGSAYVSVVDEFVQKWKAFVRITNNPPVDPKFYLREDGFINAFKKNAPDSYNDYISLKN